MEGVSGLFLALSNGRNIEEGMEVVAHRSAIRALRGDHMSSLSATAKRAQLAWPYLLLALFLILPMFVMATILAFRSGLFTFSRARPGDEQVRVFMTFIGGGLATSATFFAALLTWEHNKREHRRMQLETVIKSLDALPDGEPRVAGSIATMVLLGHQSVAMRVLAPAWDKRAVDDATATWLIGQVLEGGRRDEKAIAEAAALLLAHASHLTVASHKRCLSWPGYWFENWKHDLAPGPKRDLLLGFPPNRGGISYKE